MMKKRLLSAFLLLAFIFIFASSCLAPALALSVEEDGWYDSRDEVALYIHTFGRLPGNYVTKREARNAGWENGSLEKFFPGCSIGGDVFQNREGLLPKAKGRTYYECDIDTAGQKSRGAKRIVFSDDGLIYYTDNRYESFTLLYDGTQDESFSIEEDGWYDSRDEVALYIHTFGQLYFPGCSIGGDVFRNLEEQLPKARGRIYYECDIGTAGQKSRGAKRIIFSNDGLIYYTDDHYESFTLLYTED